MDLTIITINYKTPKLTSSCVESIKKNTRDINYEIIIIDNASKDDSIKLLKGLKKIIKNLLLIENKLNKGFIANNDGIKKAKGRYILLLNSDTEINNNVLGEMVKWMDNNRDVGVSTCGLKNKDGSLQGTGGFFPNLGRVFAWMFFLDNIPIVDKLIKPFHPMHDKSFFHKGDKFYKTEKRLDWVTGAFLFTRRNVINKVGTLGKDYFMYTEDVDFCYRVKNAGWQVVYNPSWSITHLGGASSTSEYPYLSEYRGIKLFFKKHKPAWQVPLLRLFLKMGAVLRVIVLGGLRGGDYAKIYKKAFQQA